MQDLKKQFTIVVGMTTSWKDFYFTLQAGSGRYQFAFDVSLP